MLLSHLISVELNCSVVEQFALGCINGELLGGKLYHYQLFGPLGSLLDSQILAAYFQLTWRLTMNISFAFLILISFLLLAPDSGADTVSLKNGDHLTGTISGSDGKQVTLKTDYAGEIKVQWPAVKELSSEKPLYVVTPEKKTVNGNVTVEGTDMIVHTTAEGEVKVPLAAVTIVRSEDEEQAYERGLHPRLLNAWKGGVNVGFALARGNSDTTNLNTGFTADRKTLSDEIQAYSSSVYSTNGGTMAGGPGGVTANEVLGGASYDRNITKKLFAFGSGDFTHDALQDLTVRQIYTGGLGWHAINNPNTTLDVLAGVNYTRENYSGVAPVASVGRNLPGLTAGENFMHTLGKTTVLTEDFLFYPDLSDFSQYRFSLDAGVVTKINKWLGWQASLSDRYVTNPPIPGTESDDFILSTGLNVAFSH
jgi:putative salt-induced outer membrane protein